MQTQQTNLQRLVITWTFKNWAPMPLLVTTSLCLLLRLPWHILKGTIFWFTTGHFTSRGASDSYQQGTSQAYDI